ncbi:hypothetical protein TNCV_3861981 [Trichonephila clavipes]|nr:hypothetical protein TNCV_3861981 [Trichonephila clavipes]
MLCKRQALYIANLAHISPTRQGILEEYRLKPERFDNNNNDNEHDILTIWIPRGQTETLKPVAVKLHSHQGCQRRANQRLRLARDEVSG